MPLTYEAVDPNGPIPREGRSTAECDVCGDQLVAICSLLEIRQRMVVEGWLVRDETDVFCPRCRKSPQQPRLL